MAINYGNTNDFMRNFMVGFSFIDNINSRKRQEKKLDDRLKEMRTERDYERARQTRLDDAALSDRVFSRQMELEQRAGRKRAEEREIEINAFNREGIVTARANLEEDRALEAEARAELEREEEQRQLDIEALYGSPGEQQVDPGLTEQLQKAQLPPDANAPVIEGVLSDSELNTLADVEGVTAAMEQRNLQSPARQPRGPIVSDNRRFKGTEAEKQNIRSASDKEITNAQWTAYNDVADPTGDQMRLLPPAAQSSAYFRDRSTLDLETRNTADTRVAPVVGAAIVEQTEIFNNSAPGTREYRNAKRKLSESYALAQEIGVDYSPVSMAGVDQRGLPVNGNKALTDSVIDHAVSGPRPPIQGNPDQRRADVTVINRDSGGATRITKPRADAAYRFYANETWTLEEYEYFMKNNKLMPGKATIEARDPGKDYYQHNPDGSTVLIQSARDISKEGQAVRNEISGEGRAYVDSYFDIYNTPGDPTAGKRIAHSFYTALARGESKARNMGYDYQNLGDMAQLVQRFNELTVIRAQYDDEWRADQELFPSFSNNYDSGQGALFNRDTANIDRKAIMDVTDVFKPALPLTPLKERDPGFAERARQKFPELAGKTDAEINQIADEQGL